MELVQAFPPSAAEVSIACLDLDNFSSNLDDTTASEIDVRHETINSPWQWLRFFRAHHRDAVVFVKSWTWCFPWYVCLLAWLAGVPRRVAIAHMSPSPAPSEVEGWSRDALISRIQRLRYRINHRRLALGCSTTICVSNAIRAHLVEECGFSEDRTFCVSNGVDVVRFAPNVSADMLHSSASQRRQRDQFTVVCVARLSEEKRVDILLNAVHRVVRVGIDCSCIIVGDGPLRSELVDQAQALGISDRVVFQGFQRDVRPYLLGADAFVLTSDIEGMPISLLEAMACGVPCVASDVGGVQEVITHGRDGLVVAPGSAQAVADAIAYLARNPRTRLEMSKLARARVVEAFDSQRTTARILDILLN